MKGNTKMESSYQTGTDFMVHNSNLRHLLAVFFISAAYYVLYDVYVNGYPTFLYWVGGGIILFGFIVFEYITHLVNNSWKILKDIEKKGDNSKNFFSEYDTNKKFFHSKTLFNGFSIFYLALITIYVCLSYFAYDHPFEKPKTGNTILREHTTVTTTYDTLRVIEKSEIGQDNN